MRPRCWGSPSSGACWIRACPGYPSRQKGLKLCLPVSACPIREGERDDFLHPLYFGRLQFRHLPRDPVLRRVCQQTLRVWLASILVQQLESSSYPHLCRAVRELSFQPAINLALVDHDRVHPRRFVQQVEKIHCRHVPVFKPFPHEMAAERICSARSNLSRRLWSGGHGIFYHRSAQNADITNCHFGGFTLVAQSATSTE